jgi:hypothetical protein
MRRLLSNAEVYALKLFVVAEGFFCAIELIIGTINNIVSNAFFIQNILMF